MTARMLDDVLRTSKFVRLFSLGLGCSRKFFKQKFTLNFKFSKKTQSLFICRLHHLKFERENPYNRNRSNL